MEVNSGGGPEGSVANHIVYSSSAARLPRRRSGRRPRCRRTPQGVRGALAAPAALGWTPREGPAHKRRVLSCSTCGGSAQVAQRQTLTRRPRSPLSPFSPRIPLKSASGMATGLKTAYSRPFCELYARRTYRRVLAVAAGTEACRRAPCHRPCPAPPATATAASVVALLRACRPALPRAL